MSDTDPHTETLHPKVAHQPGSSEMPAWDVGALPEAPRLTLKSWTLLIGPGLVMGGTAIGGGEWIAGPLTTAKYGGAILWLTTLSILAQVVYNLEISRYTLYCGEPISTGKFRTLPGPLFWLAVYLVLDFGSVFPYIASAAATPLAAVIVGEIADPAKTYEVLGGAITGETLLRILKYVVFIVMLAPLVFGGKVYYSLKLLISFKIVVVLGFLLFVATMYSSPATWREILTGFVQFGSVPVKGEVSGSPLIENVFVELWQGRGMPDIDFSMVAVLAALAAISGSGGLTNTAISSYTRDQGWGMGRFVGAVPSMVGGEALKLSHTGMVFEITRDSVRRFRNWYRFVVRDQLVVWMPACFVGVALPCMLSVEFLPRNTDAQDWEASALTADGLREAVGPEWGQAFWLMTLFCGFLVLAPNIAMTADGVLRRWVDVCWTALPPLRRWDPHRIRTLYFGALCGYAGFGLVSLTLWNPVTLLKAATIIYNAGLGFSCFHVLAVNLFLLPREIRPGWFMRIGMVLGGVFFLALSVIAALKMLNYV
ncbi:MAG: Nramp family divalent metal transporter [Pirellulales bacterium]|nr:Nramp family divalent metal transporter [Pirellulales bacterium]